MLRETVEHADGERVAERVEQWTLGEDTDDAGGSLSQGRGGRVGAAGIEILGCREDALMRRVGFASSTTAGGMAILCRHPSMWDGLSGIRHVVTEA